MSRTMISATDKHGNTHPFARYYTINVKALIRINLRVIRVYLHHMRKCAIQ